MKQETPRGESGAEMLQRLQGTPGSKRVMPDDSSSVAISPDAEEMTEGEDFGSGQIQGLNRALFQQVGTPYQPPRVTPDEITQLVHGQTAPPPEIGGPESMFGGAGQDLGPPIDEGGQMAPGPPGMPPDGPMAPPPMLTPPEVIGAPGSHTGPYRPPEPDSADLSKILSGSEQVG